MTVLAKSATSDLVIAIHTLIQTGELPKLYSVPRKQYAIEKAFIKELRKALQGFDQVLLRHLERRGRIMSPENLFGYFEADVLSRATSLEEAYSTHMGLGMEMGFLRGAAEVKEMIGITMAWDLKNPAVQRILKEGAFTASQKTMERMLGDVQKVLRQSYDKGLGTDEVAGLLKGKFENMTNQHLELIARTEIGSAQNQGAMESYDRGGIKKTQWLAASDDRVRDSHFREHGQIVNIDERFPNTGLLYPGDKSGEIYEWVNCRCAVAGVVK